MAIKLKTAPTTEPISLAEAKVWLRITDSVDDAIIGAMIASARRACEEYTGRALVTQTWTLWLDQFPCRESLGSPLAGWYEAPANHVIHVKRTIDIPRPPLQSVTFLKTYDIYHVASVFSASNYLIDTDREPGRLALNLGALWPVGLRYYKAIEIEFVAGYGTASTVPEDLKMGMYQLLKAMFAAKSRLFESDNEVAGIEMLTTTVGLPSFIKELWAPYRMIKI